MAEARSCGLALGSSRTGFWDLPCWGWGQGSDHWAPVASFSSHTSPHPQSLGP